MNILLNKTTAEKYGAKYVVIAGDIVMARDDKALPKWSDIAATEERKPLSKWGLGEMLVITTKGSDDCKNGAIALFYKGVLKALAGKYYLVPSSIHEWLAVPKSTMTKEDLAKLIRMVNASEVAPDERLSDRPYIPVFRGKWTIEEA